MGKGQTYKLKIYDIELARFEFEPTMTGFRATGLELSGEHDQLLPLNILRAPSDLELARFLVSRRIPKGRAYLEEMLRPFGLSVSDTKGIIDVSRGVSVNDAYSVVPVDDDIPYRDYNLFENEFDEVLQIIAYTGVVPDGVLGSGRPSDLTQSGVFPKTWRKVDGELVLYKAGSVLAAPNYGHEPFAEYLASVVALAGGYSAVRYGLAEWKGRVCSTCRLFNDADTAFVPFDLCLTSEQLQLMGFEGALAFFDGLSPEASDAFRSMAVFDSIIANTDRHTGNFGVMRDNLTGEVVGIAPIFDNNVSLFTRDLDEWLTPDAMRERIADAPGMLDATLRWQGTAMLGPLQRDQVERLVDFQFDAASVPAFPADAVSERRLSSLSAFIRERASSLLEENLAD